MTREEAIEELKILRENYWDDDGYGHETKQYDDTMLALDMAIKALEQEQTTKDDLAVDVISRQALLNATVKKSSIWNHITNSEGDSLEAIVSKLPSVTPIRPKGHWINKQRLFDSCSAECSACHKCSNGYMHDNGFSLECKYYDFCPKCGADMRGNTKRKGKPIEGNNESYNCENWIP